MDQLIITLDGEIETAGHHHRRCPIRFGFGAVFRGTEPGRE